MKKHTVLTIFLVSIFLSSSGQFDTSFIKTSIRKNADSLTYAFKSRDWSTFARFTNPALVGSLGGTQDFVNFISGTFSQLPDSAWKKYETGKILQVVKTPGEYQAIIELITIIEWQGTRTTSTSHLIGQSWDGGLFWTFFDSQGEDRAAKLIKPDLDVSLVIPPRNEKHEPYR